MFAALLVSVSFSIGASVVHDDSPTAWAGPTLGTAIRLADGAETFRFVRNDGQWDISARFVVEHGALTARLAPGAIGLQVHEPAGEGRVKGAFVRLVFEGADEAVRIEGEGRLPGVHHYLMGNDPAGWRRHVPLFSRVRYRGLYPGIDLVVRGQEGHLEYDVIVEPSAELSPLVIRCEGAEGLEIDRDGALVIHTAMGELRQPLPVTWAERPGGAREPLPCRYLKVDESRYAFIVNEPPTDRRVVIDPGLLWASYLGDRGNDRGTAVGTAPNGDVFVAGITGGLLFPTTEGAFDTEFQGGGFITRFSASGSNLVYSTFLGGGGSDQLNDLVVEPDGSVVVVGYTSSSDFPMTSGAFDTNRDSPYDSAFVSRLSPDGSQLVSSTYLEGLGSNYCWAVARSPSGLIAVTGGTNSANFPTTPNAVDRTLNDSGPFHLGDVFVTVFESDLSALRYSTFLGGSRNDTGNGIDVDADGNIIVAGGTGSQDFPVTPGAFDSGFLGSAAFVARIDTFGSTLRFSTILGGDGGDWGTDAAFAPDGSAYAVGFAASVDFPTTPGAMDRSYGDGEGLSRDGFVARFAPDGTAIYSTFLGGTGNDQAWAVAVDALGAAIVTGDTTSLDFPISAGALQPQLSNDPDRSIEAFVTRLRPDGTGILYSTYFGGQDSAELSVDLALGPDHTVAIGGRINGRDLPVTEDAYDRRFGVDEKLDAWAAVLSLGPHVRLEGTPQAGSSIRFVVESAPLTASGHLAQVLLSCSGTDGIPLPTTPEELPLTFDTCTQLSLSWAPILRGTLDSTGRTSTPWIALPPNIPSGLPLHAAALSWDPASGRISSVSCPLNFTTQ